MTKGVLSTVVMMHKLQLDSLRYFHNETNPDK